jgi:RNA polymerase sigma-70 factor (ECF subfamily)
VLDNVEARADLVDRLGQQFDLELFEEAVCRVQLRVRPTTWMAFQLHEREGLSGAEAADRIGISVAQVFVYSKRVLKLIGAEIRKLEDAALHRTSHDPCLSTS